MDTARGVPLACSRGASGAICSSGTPMNAQLCVSAVAVVSRRGGGRLASRTRARRRLRREEMKKGHGRAMNGSVSRMRAPVLFVRASTRVARVEQWMEFFERTQVSKTGIVDRVRPSPSYTLALGCLIRPSIGGPSRHSHTLRYL